MIGLIFFGYFRNYVFFAEKKGTQFKSLRIMFDKNNSQYYNMVINKNNF